MVGKSQKKNILWYVRIIGNSKFSVHEQSFIGAQTTHPSVYVLYVGAFADTVAELSSPNFMACEA